MTCTKHFRAFTLVELMTALAISLILLVGVIELFRSVGGTIQETQATLNMSSELNMAAVQLREDLKKVNPKLAYQPHDMVSDITFDASAEPGGYFEIIEGMNAPYSYINGSGNINGQGKHILTEQIALNSDTTQPDLTVGDVDDILMFTARSDAAYPFRGLVNGDMRESSAESSAESLAAEIIYFVRGNTLYRRVLLIKDSSMNLPLTPPPNFSYRDNDISVSRDTGGTTLQWNTLATLKDRRNRSFHYNNASGSFPFPIHQYTLNDAWYYLRLPTLEETVSTATAWSINNTGLPSVGTFTPAAGLYLDLWNEPYPFATQLGVNTKSGSLISYVSPPPPPPQYSRAGEDIVLKNVLSFDVKVWNPYWVPLDTTPITYAPPQYVDLGQDKFQIEGSSVDVNYSLLLDGRSGGTIPYTDSIPAPASPSGPPEGAPIGYAFTTKGHYGGVADAGSIKLLNYWDGTNPPTDSDVTDWPCIPPPPMSYVIPCVFDSWTKTYEDDANDYRSGVNNSGTSNNGPATPEKSHLWACPPPYSEKLTSIQITIRCFHPDSKTIRQVRVVHYF